MNEDIRLLHGDCLELLKAIPAHSIDAIVMDPPFQVTGCTWDIALPFKEMWEQFRRVIKPYGPIVLFGVEPFSSHLRLSNLGWYKYDWVWVKSRKGGFVNAKLCPLRNVEYISVFSEGTIANCSDRQMPYYPQDLIPYNKKVSGVIDCKADRRWGNFKYARPSHKESMVQEYTNYPVQTLVFASESKPVHPTQKPVPLLEYLIRTYTQEGGCVLDATMGVGSTGVASVSTGRKFVGMELHKDYYDQAVERVRGVLAQKELPL